MKICIDISLLGNIYTGQHIYIVSLLKEMLRKNRNDEFILFTYNDCGKEEFKGFENTAFFNIAKGKYSRSNRIIAQFTKINPLIEKTKPDVFFSPAFVMTLKNRKIKKITTVHDLIYKKYPGTYSKLKNIYFHNMLKNSIKNSDIIIAISKNTKKDIINTFKIDEEKIKVVHYGVDDIFRESIEENTLQDIRSKMELPERYFLYVGTLEPRKNIPYVLKNFDRFSEIHPEYKLLIYGWKGELPKGVFETMKDMKNKSNVEFRGYIDHDVLPNVYKLSKGLLFLSKYEGFGLPPVEALCSGCNVYVSDRTSIPEIVGDAGFYVDIDKDYGLFEVLRDTYDDNMLRSEKIRVGYEIAKKYTWEKAADETYNCFNKK